MARVKAAQSTLQGWGRRFLDCVGPAAGVRHGAVPRQAASTVTVLFEKGAVVGKVLDRGGVLHRVEVKVRPLPDATWKKLLAALCADPDTAAALAQGRFGPGVDAAAKVAGADLFDPLRLSVPRCTCYKGRRCSHTKAVVVEAAGRVEQNPFLWLEVLGRSRREVLAHVHARLGTAPAGPPLDPSRFWSLPQGALPAAGDGEAPAGVGTATAGVAAAPASPPVPSVDLPQAPWAVPVIQGYLEAAAALAQDVRAGSRRVVHLPASLPGEPVDLPWRLVPEVATAVQAADGLLDLDALVARCPTAAAMDPEDARLAVATALAMPIPGAVTLGYGYAGRLSAALAGVAFRHVVSFADWLRGGPSGLADWALILQTLGFEPPYSIHVPGAPPPRAPGDLFAHLRPEVGDEIWIHVESAEPLRLTARRVPRAQRDPAALAGPTAAAARVLVQHMERLGLDALDAPQALAFLLGAGHFRPDQGPDTIWLLPDAAAGELAFDWTEACLVRGFPVRLWPVHDRPWSWWPEQDRVLKRYRQTLMRRGTPRAVQWGLTVADLWLRRWHAPHDQPGHAPGLGPFLAFLWIEAPALAARSNIPSDAVPELLDLWLAFLSEQDPALAAHYAPHRAACRLVDAFLHRCRTLPRRRNKDLDEWQREGYRWLGPELCFTHYHPGHDTVDELPSNSTADGRTV